ncbi:3-dehydroquinate synthase [Pyrodictium delaneyi]|uniref:3-dehydroquinate synthase n=1 Tax=Pyrodictium delaneyi TaxID=1273541 RepID=A0A211YQS9_9CREN|nr:3-dehydroquinate synthase [Pyrodictium delaneyi]OWJ55405.1 3-dehydroquinate synthase [Pyrodictium delaneyi]
MNQVERSCWVIQDSHDVAIIVGPGARRQLGQLALEQGPYSAAVVVADAGAPRSMLRDLLASLQDAGIHVHFTELPGGEETKSLETVAWLWNWMARENIPRDALLVAYGGGAVSDTAGFAAATYMRGIDWATVPTTLLAMADAAVGGKTAVNLEAKNIVGVFHHPRIVIADVDLLETLPEEEYISGLVEIVKHAAIHGRSLLEWLRENSQKLLDRDPEVLTKAIRYSLDVKMDIVVKDYREKRGDRMILNLGHTVAHAIEKAMDYSMRHGYAVAIGLVVEGIAATLKLGTPREDIEEIRQLLSALGLPTAPPPGLDPQETLQAIMLDKKRRGDKILVPMLKEIGSPTLVAMKVDEALELLAEAWHIAAKSTQ